MIGNYLNLNIVSIYVCNFISVFQMWGTLGMVERDNHRDNQIVAFLEGKVACL